MEAEKKPDVGTSSLGLPANVAAFLAYVLGFVSGLVVFLLEKQNTFVKFHAFQSLGLSLVWIVCSIVVERIPVLGGMFSALLNLAGVVVWILLMVKAYQGERFRLPVIGDLAAKQAG